MVFWTLYLVSLVGSWGNFGVAYTRHYKALGGIVKIMKSEKPVSDGQNSAEVDSFKVVLGTIGDTTWRMFVPSIGFTLLGVYLDSIFETKPWLMIVGIVFGAVMAILLVKLQINRLKSKKESAK